ncbi:thioredoxin [Candidatus Calescamantes bacterium]|nr:thioredoxin [Candidatus Calescamantes bacterium]
MVIPLTDINFRKEVLEEKGKPVLVDFWAPWCGPCMIVSPIVEEISMEYAGKVKVCKLNVDEAPVTATDYGVMAIPTLIIFKDGEEKERIVGAVPKETIVEKLKNYIEE